MYLAIIILPLLGSIVSGFFGRRIGVGGAQIVTCVSVIVTTLLAIIAFFEVGLKDIPVSIQIFRWIESGSLVVLLGFQFDALTVSMLIPVLIVSSLVHIYSIGYMSHDPHNQRFFCYLSLFTFMMIILVTANNFLLMFIGWEGSLKCLIWLNKWSDYYRYITGKASIGYIINKSHSFNNFKSNLFYTKKYFFFCCYFNKNIIKCFHTGGGVKLRSWQRIGPHNIDVLSVLIGSILGNSQLEKRNKGKGTRVIFEQYHSNVEYLMWFHKLFSIRGYCSPNKPRLTTTIKNNNKVLYRYRVSSYTFTSLNWLHGMFYKDNIKIIPYNISDYLTPLVLAIWFMDDGYRQGKVAKIAINCFTKKELNHLCLILKTKFDLDTSIHNAGNSKGVVIYIKSNSMLTFTNIIKPHMLPSLYYKLGHHKFI